MSEDAKKNPAEGTPKTRAEDASDEQLDSVAGGGVNYNSSKSNSGNKVNNTTTRSKTQHN